MKRSFFMLVLAVVVGFVGILNAETKYLTAKPMSKVVKTSLKKVKKSSVTKLPVILWGGDIATIHAATSGIFKKEGLNISLFREDDFAKQVEKCLSGETPYLRGTMGMINAAADAFNVKGLDLVVFYQLTWSTGGDALVVRSGKNLSNVKTIALQLYGPHMDYAANVLSTASRKVSSVKFKWFKELTIPDYETKFIVDPVTAFEKNSGIDGVMCIIPDALRLTSNGNVGSGSDRSVMGAKITLTTKTANKVIGDVYAVRGDYFKSNPKEVYKLAHALLLGQESLKDMSKTSPTFNQLISKSADMFFGTTGMQGETKALLGDCEFVGYNGNVAFFTGKGTSRNLSNMTSEIQNSFLKMGLLSKKVKVTNANLDYSRLSKGLKYASGAPVVAKKKFDKKKVTASIEKRIAAEASSWEDDGTLFKIEINFEPNQSVFAYNDYIKSFSEAMKISQTYGGALIIIEGHSDPLGIAKARKNGESKQVLSQMEQSVKNLSMKRAQAVRASFLSYCKKKNLIIDESQFIPVGMGVKSPRFAIPKTKEEWAANRRVVFRIKQVEAEASEFSPL